jgi:hypothetical protein
MEGWLSSTLANLSSLGLITGMQLVAGGLVSVGFVWHLVAFFYFQRGYHPLSNFLRMVLAFAIITNTVPITQFFMGTWALAYNTLAKQSLTVARDGLNTVATSIEEAAPNLAALLAVGTGLQVTGGALATTAGVASTNETLAKGSYGLVKGAWNAALKGVMRLATAVISLFFAIVVGTGFAISIAGLFLPLAAACLLLPVGETGLIRWLTVILAAHVGILILPIILGIGLEFIIFDPLQQVVLEIGQVSEAWRDVTGTFDTVGVNAIGLPDWNGVLDAGKSLAAFAGQALEAVLDITFGTVVRIVVGFIITLVLLGLVGYYINSFIGNLIASVQNGTFSFALGGSSAGSSSSNTSDLSGDAGSDGSSTGGSAGTASSSRTSAMHGNTPKPTRLATRE